MAGARELIHATAIALGGNAALIRGPSGSGKSDLALRCLTLGPSPLWSGPIHLVADDQVEIVRDHADNLIAAPPVTIRGLIEIRGIGIVTVPFEPHARVRLIVDLVPPEAIERMPDAALSADLLGVPTPLLRLAPLEASAAAKLVTRLSLCRS